jgi:hypothetical protein
MCPYLQQPSARIACGRVCVTVVGGSTQSGDVHGRTRLLTPRLQWMQNRSLLPWSLTSGTQSGTAILCGDFLSESDESLARSLGPASVRPAGMNCCSSAKPKLLDIGAHCCRDFLAALGESILETTAVPCFILHVAPRGPVLRRAISGPRCPSARRVASLICRSPRSPSNGLIWHQRLLETHHRYETCGLTGIIGRQTSLLIHHRPPQVSTTSTAPCIKRST